MHLSFVCVVSLGRREGVARAPQDASVHGHTGTRPGNLSIPPDGSRDG